MSGWYEDNIWHVTLGVMYVVGFAAGLVGCTLVRPWGLGIVPVFCLGANVWVCWANRLELTYLVFVAARVREVRQAGSRGAAEGQVEVSAEPP